MFSEEYYLKIITENLYLHFFNREIYRGIYGEQIEKMQIDHSDILSTIMLCGCNILIGSYSAYHETITMLTEKGKLYRELNNYGVIKISGETLNSDIILWHKQEIYSHVRRKYPGYFNKQEINSLGNIIPSILKPDVTDNIESLFVNERWEKIIKYAPSKLDISVIKENKKTIGEVIKKRENKAITKSIFDIENVDRRLSSSVGRTLTGIYVEDYRNFINGDIITGIPGLKEYDFLSQNFPAHDYEILKELLKQLGFPMQFRTIEFEILLKNYYSVEHEVFVLKFQELLHLLYSQMDTKSVKITIEMKRIYFLEIIRKCLYRLKIKKIDFLSQNFFQQGIYNAEQAIVLVQENNRREEQDKMNGNKKVFVVTGRDDKLRLSIFNLLRALKLEPMEWMDVMRTVGPSAYVHEAIKNSINEVGAIVVIMAPEEKVQLIKKYQTQPGDEKQEHQPRPNVIFEAGLALGLKEEKTIILQFGETRIFTDILGKHILKYRGKSNEIGFKNDFYQKLRMAGCDCEMGNDYLSINIDYK